MKSAREHRDKYFGTGTNSSHYQTHRQFNAIEFEEVAKAIQADAVKDLIVTAKPFAEMGIGDTKEMERLNQAIKASSPDQG